MISYDGYDDVIKSVHSHNQEHVFENWDGLSNEEKKDLLEDCKDIDFDLIKKLYSGPEENASVDFNPAPYIPLPKTEEETKQHKEARDIGKDFIKQGKVAAFLVAGGQGSRLGYDGPKGKFPVGPVSGNSLFRIHGEKIAKYSEKYGVAIPWLIMTSRANHDETVEYLEENNYFGLNKNDVLIFPQNMIPSLDLNGKLMLETKNRVFKNPDGHGGSLTALATSGALAEMKKRGVEIISFFQVDNPLIKIIDPAFIGFHVINKADISSKALKKAYAEEKVGVFVEFSDSRIGVVEYSDMPQEKTTETDANGELTYSSGSIAIHLFSSDFVEKITSGSDISLPYHTAQKKIKAFQGGSQSEIEGFKFEKFVFDSLLLTQNNIVFETLREEEFAPVKNASGVDSVDSSQKLMIALHRSWLEKRGIAIPAETKVIEISPLFAIEAEDLDSSMVVPGGEKILLK
ncbi:MAG: UDPGP type 1 family protein [bacterium]|nr:UDPGP type 1 family protein [bacterium]